MAKVTYRDLSLDFATHPVTGDLVMKNDVAAILQSIRSLVLTTPGEILWDPQIGGGVNRVLFEQNDHMLKMQLFERITQTINKYEPRIELIDVNISRFENGNGVNITIKFYYLNNPEPIIESIPLKRLR